MERLFYLDNSATTRPCDEAVAALSAAVTKDFGNPSSLYIFGMNAEKILSDARATIAERLDCREDEVFFTSGGTESNNTAIFSSVKLLKRRGNHIVTTSIEHPSVLEPIRALEKEGFEVDYLKPDKNGVVPISAFEKAIRKDTILVSAMLVNNEVGSVLPIGEIKQIIKNVGSPALLHTDCVQAFGKIPVLPNELSTDLVSISAHKIHGVKGAGALYVKKGLSLPPFIVGGGQEKGLRSGTEAVPAIAAFGAAVKALPNLTETKKLALSLKQKCLSLLKEFDNVSLNSPEDSLPYILNFSFTGYRSETLLHHLESFGVLVSSGSACSKGKGSYVLLEMGLPQNVVDSALRISFSRFNTEDDIEALYCALKSALKLRKSKK